LAEFRRYTRLDLSLSRRPIQSPARRAGLNKYGLVSKLPKVKLSKSMGFFELKIFIHNFKHFEF
jgi:hypothetical protein